MNAPSKTVLFTDVVGSTEFASVRGDEMSVALLRVHEEIARDAAGNHGGQVVKSTGDGFLLVFSSCADGVAAALEIRDRLDEYNVDHDDAALHVRIGLNTGPVIEEAGDFHGVTVNAAARVAAKARSGQVLVSEAVLAEASSGTSWTFVDRGLFWLKGLREQWRLFEATSGEVASRSPALDARTPFVDRDVERATLRRGVDRANDGHGALVVVVGSAGAGKTRLVEEIGVEARARGLEFLVGRGHETSRGEPYTPFVEVFGAVQRRLTPQRFRELLGEDAGEIARLLPNLRRSYSDIPPPAELPSNEARRYLFMTVQEVLARLAAVRPLVVLVDDLHWADGPSLLLLDHLAAGLEDLPILVVATYTREEVTVADSLHVMLTQLHRRRLVQTVDVGDLAEPDVERLLAEIGGTAPPPASVPAALFEATAGNPFFLEEVVHQLVEQGRLLADGRWHDAGDMDLEVPESIRLTIESRLEKLHPNTRQMLGTAALIGRDFGFELLDVLGELSEDELVDAVDEAERARLITSAIDRSTVRFAFAHELIRQTLVNELSLTRRQRLHLRVADALEQVHEAELAEYSAAIAYQLEGAGNRADSNRTVYFLIMAAERALEAAAHAEALRHFERALPLIGDDARQRAIVSEGMGTAERSLGHLDSALRYWRTALECYGRLGDQASVARLCLDAAVQVAFWRGGSDAIELVDRGLRALDDQPSPQRAGLLALSGRIASQSGVYDRGEELLTQALVSARTNPDDRVLGLTLYSRAAHHFSYNQFALTVAAGLESIECLRRVGDVWNLANVLGYVGTSLGWLGRFEEAAALGAEGEALAQRLGNWSAFVFAEQSRSFRDVGSRPAPAILERRGEHALQLGHDMGFPWLTSIGHTRIGIAAFWRGRWHDALAHFEDAARLEVRGAGGGHRGRLFVINAYLGNRETALELLEQPRSELPVLGRANTGTSWGLAAAAVEALTVLEEDEAAAALYDTMAELAATGTLMRSWDYRLVATLQGMSAACGRDWDRAEAHFEDALRIARDLPMRIEAPEACRFYARMLVARNRASDRDRARALFERAAAGYVELGMPRHEELLRADAAGL